MYCGSTAGQLKQVGMVSSRRLERLSIVLLGLGQMCIMTGYDTQSFVAESVLHSVNGREPTRIDAFAGYYGYVLYYAGHGAYLTSHSTRATIEQNSAIAWTIACLW
ncbi:hypothetical protein NECAME_02353 [Necator americanus]|uniref:Uncharacterized protein n=1 Tax=Necator americanus TaxID=51031 RepID=W2TEW9_NECAM|nr:hypothetical protein NECAME_02353 [Necator americanus]ETN80605.1 hypothetical protein NECAME_02353 [Necator americanus]